MTGPVQVLVVGFDEPSFSGEVIAELTRLREAGIVRLVDLLLVSRADDGSLVTLPPPPGVDPGFGQLTASLLSADDVDEDPALGEGDAWSLDDAIVDTGCAAVALIEHTWAGPLVAAIHGAGGRTLDETWLAASDLERLGRLDAVAAD
jgi:hypothetical protein